MAKEVLWNDLEFMKKIVSTDSQHRRGDAFMATKIGIIGDGNVGSALARGLADAFKAVKMNYELLGNQLPHIHWHIVPRLSDDPAPRVPPWMVEHAPRSLAAAELEARLRRIRDHLGS